ncbi:hypothetical protein [Actinokineospora inagensis]|uniref:hypothetical protein n=1 Tax=Actinokineospora inagensis TaxID=103730 RepID=UPI000429A2AB|nr:hypothetical protein [Actinokineospora inagensis]
MATTTAGPAGLAELGELLATRPTLDTPPAQVAVWLDRKAAMLDAVAAHPGTTPAGAADARDCAARARSRAAALRAGRGVTR